MLVQTPSQKNPKYEKDVTKKIGPFYQQALAGLRFSVASQRETLSCLFGLTGCSVTMEHDQETNDMVYFADNR